MSNLANYYLDGTSLSSILRIFSISKEEFISQMEEQGLVVRQPNGAIPQKREARVFLLLIEEARAKRDNGASHKELAAEYNVSAATVQRFLSTSSAPRKKFKRVDGERMEKRDKLVFDVLSFTDCHPKLLSEVFNTSVSNIYLIKRREEERRGITSR